MIRRATTLILLFGVLLGSAHCLHAQVYYEFLLQAPVVDSANNNQWAVGQTFWIEASPSFSGNLFASNTSVNSNGYLEDSVYINGPGTGTLLLKSIDCHGDTVVSSVAFDSTFTFHVADTVFICAAGSATCAASFTVNNTPGNPTVSFQCTSTGTGTITGTDWSFGDGNYSAAMHPVHTYQNNGYYYVGHTVYYSTGCQASVGQNITVTGGNIVCSTSILPSQWGNATNFYVNHVSSGTPTSFDWNFGDGQTLTTGTNGIFHTYATSGAYNVCVTTTFSDGCMDTVCQSMNIVVGGSGTCSAWFSHGVNGQTVYFQDSTTATSPVHTWWWDFGDGAVDSTSGPMLSHTYGGQGPYAVRLEIFTSDTCYDSAIDTVDLQQTNACRAGFTHAPDTSGQYTILAYNTSSGTNLNYHWDFGDGGTSTLPYPVHQFAGAGTYLICLDVTQPSPACADTFCDSVTITQKQAMAFTFAVWNPATAVADAHTAYEGLHVAPQPVRDRLRLSMPSAADGPANLRIYDACGQLLLDKACLFASGKCEIEVIDLPNGLYVLRLGSETARFWVMR